MFKLNFISLYGCIHAPSYVPSEPFRAFKTFLSRRLIINSGQLWKLHQRHKFLKAEASRDILKFSLRNGVSRGF